jgi:arylsulfatase A-like enzyme
MAVTRGHRPNILFVTMDQFRADALSCLGHPVVKTPTLDGIAAEGVHFVSHYANSAPCAPGRASLYTGMYQMNHRVVANGTPLDHQFDNIARLARRAGYRPVLFGYTDQAVDPREVTDSNDPRLRNYEGILPGFDVGLDLTGDQAAWLEWLSGLGYPLTGVNEVLASEHERPAEHGVSTFLTNQVIDWLAQAPEVPWFVHVSWYRPHPPYSAPGHYADLYDPADCASAIPAGPDRHPLQDLLARIPELRAPEQPEAIARMRAQYYGSLTHVDHQLARVVDAVQTRGEWDNTIVIVTSDHGEQLGDQGLMQKAGFFEASYRIPAIIRDPRQPQSAGARIKAFTEAVDLLPTVAELLGEPIPPQCDGLPLTSFLRGESPSWWRSAAHYEWDWRDWYLRRAEDQWPRDRRLARRNLVVQRGEDYAYVHFGDGSWRCFDIKADPNWATLCHEPAVVLKQAQALLDWRAEHLNRTLTSTLIDNGIVGRAPATRIGRNG